MKIKNTSRIIAFALVVMMIVPLIGVPTFAAAYEEEAVSVYYDNDFEDYKLDATTEEAPDPDGDPNAHVVGADDYFAGNPNAEKETPVNKVVANPDGEGQVFQVDLCEANIDNNDIKAKIDEISCDDVDHLLIGYDIYIPSDAVGRVCWQYDTVYKRFTDLFYIYMDPATTDEAGTEIPGKAYFSTVAGHMNETVAYTNKLQLARNEWHSISYLVNLDSGLFNLLVDGELAAAGTVGASQSEITLMADLLRFAKLDKSSTNAAGSFYLDNMSVTVEEEGPVRPPLYDNDFQSIKMENAVDGALRLDDATAGVIYIAEGVNHAVYDPKDPENIVWRASMGKESEDAMYKLGINPSYDTYPNILIEWDMYVTADATGNVQFQYWGQKDGDTKAASTFYTSVNFNATKSAFEVGSGYMATVGSVELTREKWHSIALAQNMVTGDYSLYIDGYFVAFGAIPAAKLIINAGYIIMGKVETGYSGNGYLMYDNIKVTDGVAPEGAIGGIDTYEPSWYEQDFESFEDGADINEIFAHRESDELQTAVDFEYNMVWKRPINATYNDKKTYFNSPLVSHLFSEKIVMETSYYLPAKATGYFVAQAYGTCTDEKGSTKGGTWMQLYGVNVTEGKLVSHDSTYVYKVISEDAVTLARDSWVKVTFVLNMLYGDYDIFVDGEYAMTGKINLGYSKITFSEGYIDVCNSTNLDVHVPAEGSFVYVDNVSITAYKNQVVDFVNIKEDLISATINGEKIALGKKYLLGKDDDYKEVLFDRTKYEAMLGDITAEIRLCTDDGFRFKTEIDKDVLDAMAAEEYNAGENGLVMGTIIIPADYLEDPSVLNFKLLNDLGLVEGTNYLNVVAKDCYEDADGTYIAGSILKLQEGNYVRDFVAVSYVQMTLPLGNTSTIYGEVCAPASAAWTAHDVVDAAVDGDYTDEEMAILEKFSAKAQ